MFYAQVYRRRHFLNNLKPYESVCNLSTGCSQRTITVSSRMRYVRLLLPQINLFNYVIRCTHFGVRCRVYQTIF